MMRGIRRELVTIGAATSGIGGALTASCAALSCIGPAAGW
jgi:hypothetical protein